MATPRVYSERLLLMSIDKLWVTYTVPPFQRVVIKTITMVNGLDIPARCMAYVNGILVVLTTVPAQETVIHAGLHIVAYADEDIGGYLAEVGGGLVVSGFIFDDALAVGPGAPAATVPGNPPATEPLPERTD